MEDFLIALLNNSVFKAILAGCVFLGIKHLLRTPHEKLKSRLLKP